MAMDRATGIFVDGIGTAAATSGVLSPLGGRIFGLLYLHERPLALDEIATALEQSKSNISVNIRGLVEWHLVRHFWRVFQEIMERRFRWCVRQVLATIADAERALADGGRREASPFLAGRLGALRLFFSAIDAGFGAFAQGKPLDPEVLKKVTPLAAAPSRQRR